MKKIIVFLCLFLPLTALADYHGRVVGISDGDTLTLLTSVKEQIKVRLSGADTPEGDSRTLASSMGIV
ncbi:thermonuclease family protein [Nitrosococcus wardiae]|uniref:Nuclease n=1 Tax=Nitrosococcus wardiae TaxID=1814290 RepID=A0A4P7BUW9_9GAMM|nr:hypothetical protein [Nitrosococcus wardiae]QBQ53077.1 hypothetical protein E3U44_00065 [Nitrosococcus wardiae]